MYNFDNETIFDNAYLYGQFDKQNKKEMRPEKYIFTDLDKSELSVFNKGYEKGYKDAK